MDFKNEFLSLMDLKLESEDYFAKDFCVTYEIPGDWQLNLSAHLHVSNCLNGGGAGPVNTPG